MYDEVKPMVALLIKKLTADCLWLFRCATCLRSIPERKCAAFRRECLLYNCLLVSKYLDLSQQKTNLN